MRIAFFSLIALALLGGALRAEPDALALEAACDRSIYRADSINPVYVEAKISAPVAAVPAVAPARNIAFVLDRSGSMAGESVQALRQAVSAAFAALDEHDVVSIVLFGSEVETLLPAQRRDQVVGLDALLARIEPAGGAALYDALNQGAAQLRRYAANSVLNHLVLITDGPATKGPREHDDFTRLAELFAGEKITLSTIGLGDEFEEDLLAALARIGGGRFRYAAQPAQVSAVLQAELTPLRAIVAQEVVLRIEFVDGCREVESSGWEPAMIEDETVTYRFPHLFAGQELSLLAGAIMQARRDRAEVATVRLRWTDAATGTAHETTRRLSVYFENSSWLVQKSINASVLRTAVGAVVSEGMQRAIEQLDKGDFRRALRELRRTRDDARSMNADLEDAAIAARIEVLEAYLAEVQARGLNQLDRKILRSGLNHQFETPTAEEKTGK